MVLELTFLLKVDKLFSNKTQTPSVNVLNKIFFIIDIFLTPPQFSSPWSGSAQVSKTTPYVCLWQANLWAFGLVKAFHSSLPPEKWSTVPWSELWADIPLRIPEQCSTEDPYRVILDTFRRHIEPYSSSFITVMDCSVMFQTSGSGAG